MLGFETAEILPYDGGCQFIISINHIGGEKHIIVIDLTVPMSKENKIRVISLRNFDDISFC